MGFMKSGFILLLLFVCLAATAQASTLNTTSNLINQGIEPAAPPATILDGVPLMEGLQLATDKDLLTILPEFGGSQPTVTVGIVDVDDLYNFYKRELPPLGWQPVTGHSYARGKEMLEIHTAVDGKLTTVTFTENTAP